MRSALLLSCWLLGCVVDTTSLGDHHAAAPPADATSEEHAAEPPAMDAAIADTPASAEPPPRSEPAPQPEPGAEMTPADEPAPAADEPAAPADMMDAPSEHPPAEPPMEEPPPEEQPPPPASGCDVATDNPCLLCDQEACCEPRRACLEHEGCACHLECRGADNPAACRESCGAMGERYEPWLLCLQQHCADHCVL